MADQANVELMTNTQINLSASNESAASNSAQLTKRITIQDLATLGTENFEEFKVSHSDDHIELDSNNPVYTQMQSVVSDSHSATPATNNHLGIERARSDTHTPSKHKPIISSMFDDEYHNRIDIEELNDRDQTKMIQKQKEYEKYGACHCGYKLFRTIWRMKTLIFNAIFLLSGLAISDFIVDHMLHKRELSWRIWFYTIYLSILIFCFSLTKLIVLVVMRMLRRITKNSWSVFYVKGMPNRLYLTVLSFLWFGTFYVFGGLIGYDYNKNIWAAIQSVAITSIVFLSTHVCIRYISLGTYFEIFKQKVHKLKAYDTFLEIMLNKTKTEIFCIPIMNFLIDFPSFDDLNSFKKNSDKTVAFGFQINPTQSDKEKIKKMVNRSNANYKSEESGSDEIQKLLDTPIYSISVQKTGNSGNSFRIIKEQTLDRLTRAISYLIMVKLNEIKNDVILKNYERDLDTNIFGMDKVSLGTFRAKSVEIGKLSLLNVNNNDKINKQVFLKIFELYPKPNKKLLIDLGMLAWKKFKDKDSDYLNIDVLNMNIRQIIRDLLQLKQSIDSYIVIINNLQTLIDIMTPILLLFAYLYIFDFDLEETITLYVSSVGIIGFFGSSYFSTVFGSISFILALNPFLVGDYIMYDNVVYRVDEIALISCRMRQMSNGYTYTFQNRELGESSHPIVNFSRSNNTKYKWTFYVRPCDMTVQDIYDFTRKCKEKVKQRRDHELKNIKGSYCTYSELKSIGYKTIKAKIYELDEFGRKKLKVQMKYDEYCNDVQNLCFNCVTEVIRELGYEMKPIQIIKQRVNAQSSFAD